MWKNFVRDIPYTYPLKTMYNFGDLVDFSPKNQCKRKLLVPENIIIMSMMCHFWLDWNYFFFARHEMCNEYQKPFQQYIPFNIFYSIFNQRKYADILMLHKVLLLVTWIWNWRVKFKVPFGDFVKKSTLSPVKKKHLIDNESYNDK